jgi:hypothetical protein
MKLPPPMRALLWRGGTRVSPRRVLAVTLAAAGVVVATTPARAADPAEPKLRDTLFVGVDTSGSFRHAGYEDAMTFLAYYLYGHVNEVGGLARPRDLFVAAIGGKASDDPKAFRPIHDFAGKDVPQIEADLRRWFPPTDPLTDFNAFFRQVARITKERNLVLTPITILLVSDGIPDVPGVKAGAPESFKTIDLSVLEFLSRNVTLRLIYASPKIGDRWRTLIPRHRVRFWAVEREVMVGWRAHIKPTVDPASQERLWTWVREIVDYRVRARPL